MKGWVVDISCPLGLSWPTCGEGGDSSSPGDRALVEQTTHVEEHEEEDEDDPTQGEDL